MVDKGPGQTPGFSEDSDAFDLDAALDRVEDDEELLQSMAQLFVDQSGKLLSEIHDALERGDGPALKRAAHTLKGAVSNFSARRAVDSAQRLEAMGRAADFADARSAWTDLEYEIAKLREALAELTAEVKA